MLGISIWALVSDSVSSSNNFYPLIYEIEEPKFIISGFLADEIRICYKICEIYESLNWIIKLN